MQCNVMYVCIHIQTSLVLRITSVSMPFEVGLAAGVLRGPWQYISIGEDLRKIGHLAYRSNAS